MRCFFGATSGVSTKVFQIWFRLLFAECKIFFIKVISSSEKTSHKKHRIKKNELFFDMLFKNEKSTSNDVSLCGEVIIVYYVTRDVGDVIVIF